MADARGARQARRSRLVESIVTLRGMAREGNASDADQMRIRASLPRSECAPAFRATTRPIPHCQLHAQLRREIFLARLYAPSAIGESRSAAAPVHFFVKAAASDAPVAQIFGHAPQQLQDSATQLGNLRTSGFEKFFGGFPRFLRKQDEKLSAATGTQQDFRQTQLSKQRAREHFA